MKTLAPFLLLLLGAPGFAAKTSAFHKSDDVEDRREQSANDTYQSNYQAFETARANFVSIGRAAAKSGNGLYSHCTVMASFQKDIVALVQAADAAGPLSEVLPPDGGSATSGIFMPSDLTGVDPCTGAITAQQSALSKSAKVLTDGRDRFAAAYGPVESKEDKLAANIHNNADQETNPTCKRVQSAFQQRLKEFDTAYENIGTQLNNSYKDLVYQARLVSKRKCN